MRELPKTSNHLARPKNRDDGFTLLEVLVSLTILALSVAAIFGAFSQSLEQARQDAVSSDARILMQSLFERRRSLLADQDEAGITASGLTWKVHVSRDPDSNIEKTKPHTAAVTIYVGWGAGKSARTAALSTVAFASPEKTP
jgi:prepilin-type N-terminal cleavage/methylation domain-containing protein